MSTQTVIQGSEKAPQTFNVGAINPYSLTEAILGHQIDWKSPETPKLVAATLQKDWNELFDMKNNSPIYAGLKLVGKEEVVPLKADEVNFLAPSDRTTPSLGSIKKLSDLQQLGIKDVLQEPVIDASLNNNKISINIPAPAALDKGFSATSLPKQVFDLITHVKDPVKAGWTPAGYTWKDIGQFFKDSTQYNDPIQGNLGDCWLIAGLSAVAWADPYGIVQRNRSTGDNDTDHVDAIQFYSKPGGRDAPSALIEVTEAVIVDSGNNPIYARSREAGEVWPDVYEKAFAKWTNKTTDDQPDITTLNGGDPAKVLGQLTGKTPYYYDTASQTPDALWQLVRANSLGGKTINPMTAWTYASGSQYDGANIAANHAYTILGWAYANGKEYIVLRNPWGFWEPTGTNTYQGLLTFFDASFWRPINMIGNDGVFALEAPSFKVYYGWIGTAK